MDIIIEILIQYKNILIIIASFIVVLIIGFLGDRRFKKNGVLEKTSVKKEKQPKTEVKNVASESNKVNVEKNYVTVNSSLRQSAGSVQINNTVNQLNQNVVEPTIVNDISIQNTVDPGMVNNSMQNNPVYKDETPISPNTQFVEYNFSPEDSINNIF